MDKIIAEQADYLRRWFELGVAMDPAALRVRVEQEEERCQCSAAALGVDQGRVLYLPGCEPDGGKDYGPPGGVLARRT